MALPHRNCPPRQDAQKLRYHHHHLRTKRLEIRRRAAFQIHQKIANWPTPAFFDHVPRLPHIDSIKYMEPALTEDQLQIILTKLLRLNPARPDLANRTLPDAGDASITNCSQRRNQHQCPERPPLKPISPSKLTTNHKDAQHTV